MSNLRDFQRIVGELLTQAVEGLPARASSADLRDAVEKALKSSPEVGPYVTIEPDDSQAGFKVKVEIPLIPSTDHNLN